ncbi:unnamed protein product, partial [Ectocarpus sp. 4 AP-2014]
MTLFPGKGSVSPLAAGVLRKKRLEVDTTSRVGGGDGIGDSDPNGSRHQAARSRRGNHRNDNNNGSSKNISRYSGGSKGSSGRSRPQQPKGAAAAGGFSPRRSTNGSGSSSGQSKPPNFFGPRLPLSLPLKRRLFRRSSIVGALVCLFLVVAVTNLRWTGIEERRNRRRNGITNFAASGSAAEAVADAQSHRNRQRPSAEGRDAPTTSINAAATTTAAANGNTPNRPNAGGSASSKG